MAAVSMRPHPPCRRPALKTRAPAPAQLSNFFSTSLSCLLPLAGCALHRYKGANDEETKNTKKTRKERLQTTLRALRFFVVYTNICCCDLNGKSHISNDK